MMLLRVHSFIRLKTINPIQEEVMTKSRIYRSIRASCFWQSICRGNFVVAEFFTEALQIFVSKILLIPEILDESQGPILRGRFNSKNRFLIQKCGDSIFARQLFQETIRHVF